jgi:hypothetical protein
VNLWTLLVCTVVVFAGCRKATQTAATNQSLEAKLDACTLIANEEISAIQESPIKETKSSAQANRGFRVAQCFYTATEFTKSVVVSVTQRDPENPGKQTPKEFWNETFHKGPDALEKGEAEREQGEKVTPPKKIDGVGDEAYWIGTRFGAALYVLRKDIFIRISIGGADEEETKLKKTKELALRALRRL